MNRKLLIGFCIFILLIPIVLASMSVIGDLYVTGNIIGNDIYINAYNYTDSYATVDLSTSSEYVNVSTLVAAHSNKMYVDNEQDIVVQIPGRYKITWGFSFSGGTNNEYGMGIAKNYEIMRNCYARRTTTTNSYAVSAASCILSLDAGDRITFQMDDEAEPVFDPVYKSIGITVVRVGE